MDQVQAWIESVVGMKANSLLMIALVGFVVGLAARTLMPGRDPLGIPGTALLGIAGAFIGTFLVEKLIALGVNIPFSQGSDIYIIFSSILGSLAILLVLKVVRNV